MLGALSTAATGLEAQSANIERISNDIANVNTDGYKRSRSEFQDLMYQTIKEPGGALGSGSQSPVGIQKGLGVKVGASHKVFEQGPAKITNHPYHLMVEGNGYFPVQNANNSSEIRYTRTGAFHPDKNGVLSLSNGDRLIPEITIPNNALSVVVGSNGEVKAMLPNQGETTLGIIQLITFQNEEGLMAQGHGLYKPSLASGPPLQGVPGENGLGTIQQGALEGSNVNIANSMVDMIATQRAYEMNTKVMSVADQMLGATANIPNK